MKMKLGEVRGRLEGLLKASEKHFLQKSIMQLQKI